MERRDGTTFDCNIPNFSLESTTDSDPPHGFVVGNWTAVITELFKLSKTKYTCWHTQDNMYQQSW